MTIFLKQTMLKYPIYLRDMGDSVALISCRECGVKVSSDAKICPSCGIKKPAPKKKSKLLLLLLGIFAVGAIAIKPIEERKQAKRLEAQAANPNCKIPKANGQLAARPCDLVTLCEDLHRTKQRVADTFGKLRNTIIKNESDSSEAGIDIEAKDRKAWNAAQDDDKALTKEILTYQFGDIKRVCPFQLTEALRTEVESKPNQTTPVTSSVPTTEGCDKSPLDFFEIGQQVTNEEFSTLIAKRCRNAQVTEGNANLSWEGARWVVKLADGKNGKKTVASINSFSLSSK